MVLRVDGCVESVSCAGSLLGVFEAVELGQVEVELAPGDLLVLYTDGVLEARGPEGFFGSDRLAQLLSECVGLPAPHVAERVERAVVEFQSGQARDDVAVLVVEAVGHPEAAAPRAPASLAAPAG
jgi:serine phosphatase RsbU (regulator of sigma subunit)